MSDPRLRFRSSPVDPFPTVGPGIGRLVAALAVAIPLLAGVDRPAAGQEVPELQIHSEQYIVVDADTGEVFAQRGATERNAMASLTKVFTAIQAIEEAPPDYRIVVDESDMPDPRASYMGFSPGETYTLEELLHGLMLPSGNDAAHAIARALGTESPTDPPEVAVKRFVARMNQRVTDMGLTDTHLVRPDGWGVPGHYTTVRDLAAFMRYALKYPRFVELISAPSYTLHDGREIYNNNRMLNWYEDLIGGKTGYDDDAGWCLVEVAARDGHTMISVTFDGIHEGEDWYDDNRALLEYGFEQKTKRLAAGRDVTGEVVAFKDPDAAVLSRTATSGASIAGQPLSADGAAPAVVPVSLGVPSDSIQPAGPADAATFAGLIDAAGTRDTGRAAAAIAGVVALILVARAMGTFTQPGRRPSIVPADVAPRRQQSPGQAQDQARPAATST